MNIIKLIPTIIATVKAIEELMPEGKGADKLAAAIATIEGVVGLVQEQLPALTKLIAAIVTGLNALGIFKKKSA